MKMWMRLLTALKFWYYNQVMFLNIDFCQLNDVVFLMEYHKLTSFMELVSCVP